MPEITANQQPVQVNGHAWSPRDWPAAAEMRGPRVRLEPLSAGRHAAALHAENGDDVAMWDYMAYGPFASGEDYAGWITSVESLRDPQYYAILDQEGRARGVASYLRIDPANGVCELGNIAFSPGLRRSALATEALHLMCAQVFALGYRRFEWKCNAANLPSRRAAERLGFSYEGTFRNHMVIRGRNRDTAWFAMTDADWPAVGAAQRRWLEPGNFDAEGRQIMPLAELMRPLLVRRDPLLAG